MIHTANDIAKYIICTFHEAGDQITNMKVQKLLYYVQGCHLGLYGTPAFAGEFQAWKYGPVEPSVYSEYSHCPEGAISHKDVEQGQRLSRL